jgi:protein-L-isoaspartate(D-aspartate) O-methyltransferase
MFAIVGNLPAMEAQLITRIDEENYRTVNVFETVTAPLINAPQRDKFVF